MCAVLKIKKKILLEETKLGISYWAYAVSMYVSVFFQFEYVCTGILLATVMYKYF